MSIRARLVLGFIIVLTAGFYYVADWMMKEIRPHYMKAMEESLVEYSTLLAAIASEDLADGSIDRVRMHTVFNRAKSQKFSARIYEYVKTDMSLRVYITDAKGIVLFDSDNGLAEGQDYSKWRDVALTLAGEYGARSTRVDENDPGSGVQYVGAPIMVDGKIGGVLSVAKPKESAVPFIQPARSRFIVMAVSALAAMGLFGMLITIWITSPIQKLIRYVRNIRRGVHAPMPNLHTIGVLGKHELDELAESILFMQENLQKKRYVEQYVQTLTHEIKSPLAAIRGAAELLDETMPARDLERFAGNIRSESVRIQNMIDRMLELSIVENRESLEQSEVISCDTLFKEIIDSVSVVASEKNITISVACDSSLTVTGERFLLRQSVLNLVQNAIDFSSAGGTIDLTATAIHGSVIIRVIDQGTGIPEYAQDRLFERFYSLGRPDTHQRSSGIGLSFVKESIELHGGIVSVRNNESGVGTIAEIRIPEKS